MDSNTPKKIYLLCYGESPEGSGEDIFWSEDRVNDTDEEYHHVSEIERLKKVLEKYGGHSRACAVRTPQTYPTICNCGYEQALKEAQDGNSGNSNKKTN